MIGLDDFEDAPSRPLWLITLADLALLLVGFFVLLQATQRLDGKTLAKGFRDGFGIATAPAAMAVDLARLDGFAAGSSSLPATDSALAWARSAARDPRTRIRLTGQVDGSASDRDAATGSGAILAADRARAVAAMLARAGVAPDRLILTTAEGGRAVVLSIAFAGERQ